jgi:hypothetical protein
MISLDTIFIDDQSLNTKLSALGSTVSSPSFAHPLTDGEMVAGTIPL